jgi:uncharacterized protein (DUF1684 family)
VQFAKNWVRILQIGELLSTAFANFALMRVQVTFFTGIFLLAILSLQAQTGQESYNDFWEETDGDFKNPERSPLPKKDIADFDSVPRYAYAPSFRVKAAWVPSPKEKPFAIETTTDRKPRYQKVGTLQFQLLGTNVSLPAYKNLEFAGKAVYANRLFVPFTDLSSGETTYMGGRYIDMEATGADSLVVDFNQAYNPYCVYSDRYSCPIPPKENYIPVFIAAGARVEPK